MGKYFVIIIFLIFGLGCQSSSEQEKQQNTSEIKVGAAQMDQYLPILRDKKIGVFANHTATFGQTHLIDTLLALGINAKLVFTPEHGFKGNKPDGEKISGETSESFELVSLYGQNKYPKDENIQEIELLVVDIQDVGVRCYTYASSMTYLMEVCAKHNVPVVILDRPNPNGSYIDGPILDEQFESFVGLHPIPLVHGLTLGELALMINGEGWLKDGLKCDLKVIPVANWSHDQPYELPIPPSPNLPNAQAVALYPSLVFFEGTEVSIGRGTDYPFQLIGHPKFMIGSFAFTPTPNTGSKYPPLEGEPCFGQNLSNVPVGDSINLTYLKNYYDFLKNRIEKPFFNDYFNKLAGTDELQKQLEKGWSIQQIRKSWEDELNAFRQKRGRYLIYD